jgi:Uma2 family endonuclease
MANTQQTRFWTYEDLFDLPDNGRRYEIIEGVLYEMPGPRPEHSFIIANLMFWLAPLVRALGGKLGPAPIDLFLRGANPVQPDLLVLLAEHLGQVSERGIEGPPAMVIEVLSPSNIDHDRLVRRSLYARGGVPEYWIIDPRAETVEVLTLQQGQYQTHVLASGDTEVTSTILAGLRFPASAAFE